MSDLAFQIDENTGEIDLVFTAPDLVTDGGLKGAIITALFTDLRADDGDDRHGNRRGWWGESYLGPWGSKLWLLERAAATDANLMLAKDYAEKSLRPLVTAGVAKDISVTPERVKRASGDMLKLTVRVTRPDYVEETFEFEFAWSDI